MVSTVTSPTTMATTSFQARRIPALAAVVAGGEGTEADRVVAPSGSMQS
jgi:hypothetical protein